jgi:hypothetical protein
LTIEWAVAVVDIIRHNTRWRRFPVPLQQAKIYFTKYALGVHYAAAGIDVPQNYQKSLYSECLRQSVKRASFAKSKQLWWIGSSGVSVVPSIRAMVPLLDRHGNPT